jgi:hypothetical protein
MKTPASALAGLPTYEQHPIAIELMPGGMSNEEFDVFAEDIQDRGVIYPITIFEGKVLDGWHRYRACHRTGTAFKEIVYAGNDPAGYIAACNIHRRRLSSLQRALFGARVHIRNAVSQRDICKRYGISNTVLSLVLKALDTRNAALIKRIETDSDFSRGDLREELADRGIVHENYGRSAGPAESPQDADDSSVDDILSTPAPKHLDPKAGLINSVFNMADTEGTVGKRKASPEKRVKDTMPQRMQGMFAELMPDEKATFLQMIWPTARPIAEELKLPGLGNTASKAKLKKVG